MIISDILNANQSDPVLATGDTRIERLLSIMMSEGIGSVVIKDPGNPAYGIVTERSVISAMAKFGPGIFAQTARTLMTSPAPTCRPDDSIRQAMQSMTQLRTRHLLVTSGTDLHGLVSIGDLVKFRIRDTELENSVLRDLAGARMLSSGSHI